jgi:hypothetical protein
MGSMTAKACDPAVLQTRRLARRVVDFVLAAAFAVAVAHCGDDGAEGPAARPARLDTLAATTDCMRFCTLDTTVIDSAIVGIGDVPLQMTGDCWYDTVINGGHEPRPAYDLRFPADFLTMLVDSERTSAVYLGRNYQTADTAGYRQLRFLSYNRSCRCSGADSADVINSRIYFERTGDTCQWLFWVHRSVVIAQLFSPDMPWRGAYSLDSLIACRRPCYQGGACSPICAQYDSTDTLRSYRVRLRFVL